MKSTNKKSLLRTLFLRKRRKDESLFKYGMGLFHLWFGLLSSVVICIICITGCIYAFKNQIIDLYNYDKVFVKVPAVPEIDADEIQQYFLAQNKEINTLFIPEDEGRSWVISYTNEENQLSTTYFDPYQKKELGAGSHELDGFFQMVLEIHRNLMLGNVGRQIVGASVIVFVILLFSGFVLWLPKKIRQLKQGLTIKWDAKPQRVNYDVHRALGVYSMGFLLLISVTGLYVTYPWVKHSIIMALGGTTVKEKSLEKPEADDDFAKLMADMLARQEEKIENDAKPVLPLSKVLFEAQKHLNYKGNISLTMPNEENPRYNIIKVNSENMVRALVQDEISLDREGQLKSKELFSEKPLDKQFTSLARPLHTGEIMGLPSIILYFFASLVGFLLPITGFFIWWNRVKKQI